MTGLLATAVVVAVILGLFVLDRERKRRTSWALWIPLLWLLLSGSRPVSAWLGVAPAMSVETYFEGSPIDRAVYTLLIAAGLFVVIRRRQKVARLLRNNWPIVAFVLYCAVSVTWSDYPGVAFKRWIKSLGDYVIVLIVLTEDDHVQAIKRLFARVAFVLLPLSVLFIKYYPQWGRTYSQHWDSRQFFVGVSENKNLLGLTCMVFGFAAAWRFLQAWSGEQKDRRRTLMVHGAILAVAIWLLITCDSKTSLCCFLASTGLIGAHTFFKFARRRAALHLMVASVVLGSVAVLFLGLGGDALEAIGRNSTLTGRIDIWRELLRVPVNPIFGTGFESFWLGKRLETLWAMDVFSNINEAHNGYLEVYLNVGIVGLVFIGLLFVTGYRRILRMLDREPETGRLQLGLLVIAIIYNFTEAGFRMSDLVWIALLFAVAAAPKPSPVRVPVACREVVALSPTEQVV
jgi:exopolysaccharide production protein ExoQ